MKTFVFLSALVAILLTVGKTRACDYGLSYSIVDPGYGVAAPIVGEDDCGCDGAALLPASGYGFNYSTALVSNGFVGVRAVGVRTGGVAVGVGGFRGVRVGVGGGFVGVRAGGVGVAVGGGFGGVRVGVGGFRGASIRAGAVGVAVGGGGVFRQRTVVRRGIFGGAVVRQRTVIRGGGFGGGVFRQRTVIRRGVFIR